MTKNLENLEKTTDGIRVGSGSYLVNKKHIVVGKPSKTCVPGREAALWRASLPKACPASSVRAREGAGCGSVGAVSGA